MLHESQNIAYAKCMILQQALQFLLKLVHDSIFEFEIITQLWKLYRKMHLPLDFDIFQLNSIRMANSSTSGVEKFTSGTKNLSAQQ